LSKRVNKAVFLDRDGVINATIWNAEEQVEDSPYRLEDFKLLPGAAPAIRCLRGLGFLAVVISNQPGIAKGKCSFDFLKMIDERMHGKLAEEDAKLDGVYYCVHHPDASVMELRVICECRKPKAGLFYKAARDLSIDLGASYMIGDAERDVEAGLRAGCTTILLDAKGKHPWTGAARSVNSLWEAIEQVGILEQRAKLGSRS
jgi:mannose-1-phosphate guanylyltransferase/phosphomannomutase